MTVSVRHEDSISFVRLERPDKLNAVDEAMAHDLVEAIAEVAAADNRAMVLEADGRGFSAGRDLSGAEPLSEDATAILRETFNPLFVGLRELAMPTVASVQGPALGVGLGLALSCDITIVADDARLGSPFANIGAVLDSGGHFHFVNRLGSHLALELIYTARLLSGAEAAELGLVNRAVPADELAETTLQFAATIAAGPTAAFTMSKRLVQRVEEQALSLSDVLDEEALTQGSAAATADYAEGISAFQEKRTAMFRGR